MADSTSPIQQITAGSNAVDRVNENFDAGSPALLYGRDARTTAGLVWGYVGGRWGGVQVPSGTVTLAAGATSYLVVARATGALSASTSQANWNDASGYARAYRVTAGTASISNYEDHRAGPGGTQGGTNTSGGATPVVIPVACSDEITALTAGAGKVTFRAPLALTLTRVRASVTTAQSAGSLLTVDVNVAGASILSTKLTIDNGEMTSSTAAAPPVLASTSVPDDAEITIDIDQIGNGSATGLKVYLVGVPA